VRHEGGGVVLPLLYRKLKRAPLLRVRLDVFEERDEAAFGCVISRGGGPAPTEYTIKLNFIDNQ
jgi:hypothetical protein